MIKSIKKLKNITTEEKIEAFDKLFKFAKSIVKHTKKDNYLDEDMCHYAFGELMNLLAIDKAEFWKYFNGLQD